MTKLSSGKSASNNDVKRIDLFAPSVSDPEGIQGFRSNPLHAPRF